MNGMADGGAADVAVGLATMPRLEDGCMNGGVGPACVAPSASPAQVGAITRS